MDHGQLQTYLTKLYGQFIKTCLLCLVALFCLGLWFMANLKYPGADAARAETTPPGPIRQAVIESWYTPMGFHQYTSLSTSTDLTDGGTFTIPAGAHVAVIQATGQNIRWRDFPRTAGNTTDPTATVGMQVSAGDIWVYNGNLHYIEFIEEAASATLNVSFYGF